MQDAHAALMRSGWRRHAPAALAALAWVATGAVRLRLLGVPFERDEGVYAYFGRMLLEGVPPYVGVYGVRFPGIYAIYAGILALLPQTPGGVHLALLLVNALTAALLFGLARRLLGAAEAAAATAVFAWLSLSYGVQGVFANTEHFVLPFVVASLWGLLHAVERRSLVGLAGAGLGFGLAILVKQHAVAFALCGGLWLLGAEWRSRPRAAVARRLVVFAVAVATPLVLVGVVYAAIGAFHDLWFWTVEYAWTYASPKPLGRALANLRLNGGFVLGAATGVWALALAGIPALAARTPARRAAPFLLLLLACSVLALLPGMVFRPHYFLLFAPVASLLAAVALRVGHAWLRDRGGPHLAGAALLIVLAGAFGQSAWNQYLYLFVYSPELVVRHAYPRNPFHESLEIAEFVRAHTKEGDRIAVLGSEPQIYFYSGRRAATGFIYVYPLMEAHPYAAAMQERMIAEIEVSAPELLLFVRVRTSWLPSQASPPRLLQWFRDYQQGYELVAMMEIGRTRSVFHTGEAVRTMRSAPADGVAIYRRRR